ncbi:MAG TPA: hypothetical protein DCM87_21555 [Planctomycetes bacterium]|nr:hypothetical protein [Planctomycetota bacterium]
MIVLAYTALCAHMLILIPEQPSVRKDRPTRIEYFTGHPFEHEIQDAPGPEAFFAVAPGGAVEDLLPGVTRHGKKYACTFTPKERGDYYIVARAPVREEDGVRCRDSAKLVLHVQSQTGWETPRGGGLDIVPLTRPYGLAAGGVFRGKAAWNGAPLAGARIEVERYNPAPPAALPPDEFITAVVKADEQGIFVAQCMTAGWWALAVHADAPPAAGEAPVRHSLCFWLHAGTPGGER